MSEDMTLDKFANESDAGSEQSEKEIRIGPRKWDLPSEWSIATLGELTSLITKGKTPTSYGFDYRDSGINFIKSESISDNGFLLPDKFDYISEEADNELSSSRLHEGDLLFSIAGTLGKVTKIDGVFLPANTNQALAIIRTEDEINTDYLFYFLTGVPIQKYIKSISTVTAQPNLNLKQVSDFDIFSPPLVEQRKIATVLHTVDQAIQKTEEIIEQYKNIKSGVLEYSLTEGIGDNERTKRNIGPLSWEIPESWSVKPVGELAELVHGHQFRSDDFTGDGEIPVLKIGQITDAGINMSDADCIPQEELKEYSGYEVEEGVPLIALSGATWGKTGYFKSYNKPVLQNYRVGKVISEKSYLNDKFIYYLMGSEIFQKQLRGQVVRQAQENIGKADFERIKIPIPSIEEQKKIVEILSNIDRTIESEVEYKESLGILNNGLMQDLLSGTVRTTDTNIEVPDEIAQYG